MIPNLITNLCKNISNLSGSINKFGSRSNIVITLQELHHLNAAGDCLITRICIFVSADLNLPFQRGKRGLPRLVKVEIGKARWRQTQLCKQTEGGNAKTVSDIK